MRVTKAAAGLRAPKRRFGKRAPQRKSRAETRHYAPKKREKAMKSPVSGYDNDSSFSAISSILLTEFQLRPVPGVLRILYMRGQGSLDLPIPSGK